METVLRVTALCLTGALLAVLLHRSGGEMALLLSLAVCGVAAMVLIEPLEELRDFWEDAAAWGELPVELFTPLIKTVGIALLSRTGSDLCRDAGEGAIASVLETAGALASLVSIDMVSTQLLYKLLNGLTAPLGAPVMLENVLQEQRLKTIFENPNVFAGCAGVAILLALGLAVNTDDKKARCLHMTCLLLNSTAFLLAVSRGAMGAIAAAFLVYLLLERGQRRAVSFVLMVETLVLSGAAALCTLPAYAEAGQTVQVLPLLHIKLHPMYSRNCVSKTVRRQSM